MSFSLIYPWVCRKPKISTDMGAYGDPRYLASLAEYGEPVHLPASGAGLLVQALEGTERRDARGPYPLLSVTDWAAFGREMGAMEVDWVSLTAVADPLTAPPTVLNQSFPDLCRPFKDHFVVRMRGRFEGPWPEGHRRNLREAARHVDVERVETPRHALSDWLRLYRELCVRKAISGISAFSESAFAAQFAIPSLAVYRAWSAGEPVGMTLWLRDGDRAYYHLGAASDAGLRAGAMFALFDRALHDLASQGIERVLLGGGAGLAANVSDGLSRFKSGWANESAPAYLCGRIFDREAYARFSKGHDDTYFPAYRRTDAVGSRP